MTERELVDAILEHGAHDAAELACDRIRARILELEPLLAFGGPLGAVYAAEIMGLRYALDLIEDGPCPEALAALQAESQD